MLKNNRLIVGIIVFLMTIGIVGLVAVGWGWMQLQPLSAQTVPVRSFVVPKGQAVSVIGRRLAEEGIIKNPLAFRFIVWRLGLSSDIQAGSFDLSPSMSLQEVALSMTKGTEDAWVTIPEGKRVEEIALLFSDLSEFDQEEFIQLAKPDEGYLFPDTYLVPRLATAETVFNLMRKTFDQKTETEIQPLLDKNQKNLANVVILASLVEREARHAEDMKAVAGILQNRLDIGMALQVDATLQYVKGYDQRKKDWWPTPLASDKDLESPYNTYKYPGLPPGPISNPGISALKAAADPNESDYIYYISDNSGNMHYSVTYDEHLANIEKYLR